MIGSGEVLTVPPIHIRNREERVKPFIPGYIPVITPGELQITELVTREENQFLNPPATGHFQVLIPVIPAGHIQL